MDNSRIVTFADIPLAALFNYIPMFGSSDPLGMTFLLRRITESLGLFRRGQIVTYHPQTHSATVRMFGDQDEWPCVFSDECVSFSFGFSVTHPPREGEQVLVVPIAPRVRSGVVIGRLPYQWRFDGKDPYNEPTGYNRKLYTQLDGTATLDISGMSLPMSRKEDSSSHIMAHFRPTDVYPGEFANVNQHNCGIKGGMFSATLLGGGAQLRMSALTNAARLSCDSFARYTMHASLSEFHNGRYLSSERNQALYQEERLGWYKPDEGDFSSNVWTKDSEAPAKGENQTMRPRVKELTGLFGHLSSKFYFRPDPDDKEVRVQGTSKPKEAGVCRETVDPSGQYRLSSAGMIVIERTGRIPVPVRTAYPTDKDHDIPSSPETVKPFEHDTSDPCRRQLELYDRQAYDLKTQYARVDGLGMKAPDYYVPEEEELKDKVKDEYDENYDGNVTVKLKQYDRRRAGMYIGEDGSVIIRDAWGSEIVMLGGNVSISCAGNVMILPGRTALTVAGDDIVQKAQNSVDIHASAHDARISAARNVEIRGGGDDKNFPGGVIIESKGVDTTWDGKDKGESANVSGITLRADNQTIVVNGKNVNVRSKKDTRIISGDKDVDGEVSVAAKTIKSRAETTYISGKNSSVVLQEDNASVVAENVSVNAGSGLTLTKGSESPIPLTWSPIGFNIGKSMEEANENKTKDLSDEKKASNGYDRETLDKMVFGFRTPEECKADESWVIDGKGGLKMYEPAWVQIKDVFETLTKAKVSSQAYKEDAKWDNGEPFPGKNSGAKYVTLPGTPQNLTSEGFNKSRKDVQPKSATIDEKDINDYQVRT